MNVMNYSVAVVSLFVSIQAFSTASHLDQTYGFGQQDFADVIEKQNQEWVQEFKHDFQQQLQQELRGSSKALTAPVEPINL